MSYGIKTFNVNGTVGIDTSEVAARYIASVFIARTFNGDISIPTFDSDVGSFFLTPYYLKYNLISRTRVADSTALTTSGVDVMNQFGRTDNRFSSPPPTLSWDNQNKLLTVTQDPSALADYKLTMLHYK